MSDTIILPDGRGWFRATWVVSKLLKLIARDIECEMPDFAEWLLTKSRLPAGLVGFDIRGLNSQAQTAFLESVQRLVRTNVNYLESQQEQESFIQLNKMIELAGSDKFLNDLEEIVKFDGKMIDFTSYGG